LAVAFNICASPERRMKGHANEATSLQRDIVHLIAHGFSNKEIADLSGVPEGTVKMHVRKLYERLGVRNRTALAALMRNPPPLA
jgi:DNA-binding NarL/FixJ family response regulator